MKTRVRPYRKGDGPALLALIRDLARYEKLTPPTPAAGRRLLGDVGRRIRVLMADADGRPAGYAIYFFTYSSFLAKPTLYLEDVFVRPETRGSGLGRKVFAELRRIARRERCGRMEWTVLDWNRPAIRFYRKQRAALLREWILCRVTL